MPHLRETTKLLGDELWGTRRLILPFAERRPWNEGHLRGAKRALKQQRGWAIHFWLDQHRRLRDRALFDVAIDSKLRGCDVVSIRIRDGVSGGRVATELAWYSRKPTRPAQFELMDTARKTMRAWLERRGGTLGDYVFAGCNDHRGRMSTRQAARLVHGGMPGSVFSPTTRAPTRSAKPSVDHS